MSINELQDEVIAEFSDFDDWMDRYQLLIDLGNEQEPLDEKYKTEQNLIEGCQSRVWLQADEVDGKIVFNAESDALIVKGIIALLFSFFRLKCQRIHTYLLYHRQQTVATCRRQMFSQPYLIYKIKISIQNFIRCMS